FVPDGGAFDASPRTDFPDALDGSLPPDAGPDGGKDAAPLLHLAGAVTAGAFFTCALPDGGGVACWGQNESGELGQGSTGDNRSPPRLAAGRGGAVAAIAAGATPPGGLIAGGPAECGEPHVPRLRIRSRVGRTRSVPSTRRCRRRMLGTERVRPTRDRIRR